MPISRCWSGRRSRPSSIGVEYAILIGSYASIVWYLLHASRLKTQELVVAPEKVVRARVENDPPASEIAIYDIEGDLFFGSAPELRDFLEQAKADALRRDVKALVLRLKRVRNPTPSRWKCSTSFCTTLRRLDSWSISPASGRDSRRARPHRRDATPRRGVHIHGGSNDLFRNIKRDPRGPEADRFAIAAALTRRPTTTSCKLAAAVFVLHTGEDKMNVFIC